MTWYLSLILQQNKKLMLHLHSILRWAVLLLLIYSFAKSVMGLSQKKEFTDGDGKVGLYLMIFAHLQLLLGLALYFMKGWASAPMAESMADATARFWKVEHIFSMVIAIVLITIGRIRTKKLADSVKKHKAAVIFYGISLLLILWGIPWQMRGLY